MVYGGIQKFQKPNPTPLEVVEKAERFKDPAREATLQKILFISGSKQTGYAWQVLGICEILFGLLICIQYTSFVGAVLLLPITLQIVLFHAFLESDEVQSLIRVLGLFSINITLILIEWNKWRHLIWMHPLRSRY